MAVMKNVKRVTVMMPRIGASGGIYALTILAGMQAGIVRKTAYIASPVLIHRVKKQCQVCDRI